MYFLVTLYSLKLDREFSHVDTVGAILNIVSCHGKEKKNVLERFKKKKLNAQPGNNILISHNQSHG